MIVRHGPTAVEGLDRRIVEVVRRTPWRRPPSRHCPGATAGCSSNWSATTRPSSRRGPTALLAGCGCAGRLRRRRPGPGRWRCGRSVRTAPAWPGSASTEPAYPGWEDAAVPPEHLGAYLRDFDALLSEYGLDGLPYGHFGDGCVHVRIDFPLTEPGGAATIPELRRAGGRPGRRLRRFDVGRARRRPRPLGAAAVDVLPRGAARCSARSRPSSTRENLLNPGVLVDPRPVERRPAGGRAGRPGGLTSPTDVHRCSGVGKCLADTTAGPRRDVPVVPGDPGGEGLHPRPRPGAAGDDQR